MKHSAAWFDNQHNPERTAPGYRIGWNYRDTHSHYQTLQCASYHQLQARRFARDAMRARDEGQPSLWQICQEEAALNYQIARNIMNMET